MIDQYDPKFIVKTSSKKWRESLEEEEKDGTYRAPDDGDTFFALAWCLGDFIETEH